MTKDESWLLQEKYGGHTSDAFYADAERLAEGTPLAYLIGHVPFLSTTIYLDSQPLIPRPETEYWVEHAIAAIRNTGPKAPQVLDLCAGSGAIGVAVAHALPQTYITFVEMDAAHLSTIGKNLNANGIECTRYRVFQSDLFTEIQGMFDYILSNPPYIDPQLDRVSDSVRIHEPALALYGGSGGLQLITRIISDAPTQLTAGGQLWLEHEPEQAAGVQLLALQHGFSATTHTDQFGNARYSTLVLQ